MDRRQMLVSTGLALAGPGLARWAWAARDRWAPTVVDKRLITRLRSPRCGESLLEHLCQEWLTPLEDFFVLNHARVPELEAKDHRLVIEGAVERPLEICFFDLLDRFSDTTVVATLQCGGNRRLEHHVHRPIGDPLMWGAGAIGTARWTGPALREVLEYCRPVEGARHVWFEGADRPRRDGKRAPFAGSIPLARVMSEQATAVVLAHTMNGRRLTRNHGFPLRAVVPGFIGARSIKWLHRITVSHRPSPSIYFRESHRHGPGADGPPIYQYPLNSAVCYARRHRDRVEIAGYALARGASGERVERVEISVDGGQRWSRADLHPDSADHCWQLWGANLPFSAHQHYVVARAIDAGGQAQPWRPPWNAGGYLYNGWSSMAIRGHEGS